MLLKAYAKVNLFLEIVARRDDGYHELETILQTISLHDELELAPQPEKISITCNLPYLPIDERNLAYRAAKLVKEKTGTNQGVGIKLNKQIPVGAGLGGGSSDAAAVLLGCNRIWGSNLSDSDLVELGMQLGMDVPFFLHGGTALAVGRGERIIQQLPTPALELIIVYPNFPVPTASVYKNLDIRSRTSKQESTKLLSALQLGNVIKIAGLLFNRLEVSTFKLHPQLTKIKDILIHEGCLGALLSGSGSALFGIAQNNQSADLISRKLATTTKYWIKPVITIPQY
ncbi:MAG: 4-(cytidine 5'-diphospho)-2-C-methyl-D-erythritol kinase [bacterium]